MWFTDGFGRFQELFEYNHQVRKNYLHSFHEIISWEDMIKNRETAWLSMKDTLLHMMWVEIHGLIIRSKDSTIQAGSEWNVFVRQTNLMDLGAINLRNNLITLILKLTIGSRY